MGNNKLKDYCVITPGYAFKSDAFSSSAVLKNKAIKITDITPPFVDSEKCMSVDCLFDDRMSKFAVKDGDFVMAMTGATIGKIGKIINSGNHKIFINQRVCKFTPLETCDKSYLYYLLNTQWFKDMICANVDSTSAQPNIGHSTIYEFEYNAPDLSIQKKIGAVLSAIDKKIELNNKIIKELETMSKELYDYWFVQFDFPDTNGKPYRSSGGKMLYDPTLKREIPEGWEVNNICKVARIGSGGTPSKSNIDFWSGNIPFFGPTDYNNNIVQHQTQENITDDGLNNCSSELYKEGDVIITARGSIGKRIIVGTPMAMNQSCYALVPKWDCSEYVYMLSGYLVEALKLKGSGSVFKSIVTSDIEHTMLCIGGKTQIDLFVNYVKSNFKIISDKIKENQELATQRDWLLPMLMNGQVTVQQEQNKSTKSECITIDLTKPKGTRFDLWEETQGVAARGSINENTLKEIFDAMDDEDK